MEDVVTFFSPDGPTMKPIQHRSFPSQRTRSWFSSRDGLLIAGVLSSVAMTGCQPPELPITEVPFESPRRVGGSSLDPRIATLMTPQALAPIMGGTLLVTSDDNTAIVADPDRDRVVVVDLVSNRVLSQINLPEGAIPGRIAEDATGKIHVILRGTGEVLSFSTRDVASATRHTVCEEPRGITFDDTTDHLLVTCRDGMLLTLDMLGNELERISVDSDDLRDIVRVGNQTIVTRFRSAELQRVADDGTLLDVVHPLSSTPLGRGGIEDGSSEVRFVPRVAWRLAQRDGLLALAHQVHQEGNQEIPVNSPGAYGGGSDGCESGIVRSRVSIFDANLNVVATHPMPGMTLPVDIALGTSGQFAVIAAGEQGVAPSVMVGNAMSPSCGSMGGLNIPGPVAVALTSTNSLLVQQRDPATLWVNGLPILLGGDERFDTGHAVFHGNAGVDLACASCHPEGGEDGHVWSFTGFGSLRTPALHGGLSQTAPFHWNGDLPTMHALMDEVFERRMGGPTMDTSQENAVTAWIDSLPVSRGREGLNIAAVERGSALFYGEAQCASCHNGALLTNNQTMDVGTGSPLQVPPLVGVSLRLPVMHNGCATTLAARFEPGCGGGEAHGHTSQLSPAQLDDLVTYLESI